MPGTSTGKPAVSADNRAGLPPGPGRIAKDDIVNVAAGQAGIGQQGIEQGRGQMLHRQGPQTAADAPYGGAPGGNDDRAPRHCFTSRNAGSPLIRLVRTAARATLPLAVSGSRSAMNRRRGHL